MNPSRVHKETNNKVRYTRTMGRRIKFIWDFRGPAAAKTAEHHERHLKEYITIEKLELDITGHQHIHDMHSIASMVVNEDQMKVHRDALKPHRGEIYDDRPT